MKILMISNTDGALYNFRKDLIKNRIKKGDTIISITSDRSPEGSYINLLKELGVMTITTKFCSKNIFQQFLSIKKIIHTIRAYKPDIIHSFGHHANILLFFSLLFFKKGNNKIILTVTGLGRFFSSNSLFYKLIQILILSFYRLFYNRIDKIFFLNNDDLILFQNCLNDSSKLIHIYGEGLSEINYLILKNSVGSITKKIGKIICVFASRIMKEKGIFEYIQAAKYVVDKNLNFEFVIAGTLDKNISEYELLNLIKGYKNIHYIGFTKDILSLLNIADIIVLPSYYREGLPRVLIESLMLGKYIITTNMPGCKDTVIDGVNGRIVPIKNYISIANAILEVNEEKLKIAGICSKKLFYERFSSDSINKIIEKEYEKN
jgi:N,N'-diacetylbacillosaminyl-diphospho-undecaprenol alpha-1,3-N-acetylgalactosaminyltransferase